MALRFYVHDLYMIGFKIVKIVIKESQPLQYSMPHSIQHVYEVHLSYRSRIDIAILSMLIQNSPREI